MTEQLNESFLQADSEGKLKKQDKAWKRSSCSYINSLDHYVSRSTEYKPLCTLSHDSQG